MISVKSVLEWFSGSAPWYELPNGPLQIIFSQMKITELNRCLLVCKKWKVVGDHENVWKKIACSQVLGKQVWEESRVGDVGEEPEYRIVPFNGMDGEKISWKEVCKMHKYPSSYQDKENFRMTKMPEFDFLVPATIDGKPTTILLVMEVFAKARLPIECFHIRPDIEERYGDIPVEKSYFARHTWTVANDTREKKSDDKVVEINKKGQGLYRTAQIIEMMIFQFLSYQAGIESGYGQDPWTHSQCVETLMVGGKEYPIYAGGFKPPSLAAKGGLIVNINGEVRPSLGAGCVRKL